MQLSSHNLKLHEIVFDSRVCSFTFKSITTNMLGLGQHWFVCCYWRYSLLCLVRSDESSAMPRWFKSVLNEQKVVLVSLFPVNYIVRNLRPSNHTSTIIYCWSKLLGHKNLVWRLENAAQSCKLDLCCFLWEFERWYDSSFVIQQWVPTRSMKIVFIPVEFRW